MNLDSDSLRQAYLRTEYITYKPSFSIRVGRTHPDLDEFLSGKGVYSWAFLTAWNPGSILLTLEENKIRNSDLIRELGSFESIEGEGKAEDWKEESFLVLGIDLRNALELSKKFGQNAIVFGTYAKPAELVFVSK
ncbi:DUF3293 domain-containing protein [Leptospira wolffii]|nr:DUF3293 domain-containing protein [Leptospira wolffii]